MAATLVLDPTEGGWNIVNYDDFRNSMSAFIDRSFILYPSEDSGITDEQAIDDVAGYLGASGWTTTSELSGEIRESGLWGYLDEDPQLIRKTNNKGNFQTKESLDMDVTDSVRKSSAYKFWGKDDSDPTFITGRYGIPGDYTNSRQWNAIETDDGKWDVSVVGADGFPKEIGLYRTISEAGSKLLHYFNENGITASFNKEGRMSASVRKSYVGSFWGDTQDNGFGCYEYYYGEDGEENNSVMLYGTPTANGVDCVVVSPEGDTLDSYSADDWKEAKGRFDTDCRINHLYDDCIYDPQDPFANTTASKRISSENCVWDKVEVGDGYSFNFGPKDDYLKGLTVEVGEGDDGYEYIAYGSDGDIVVNEDGFSTADEALKEAIAWCEGNPESVTASVKTASVYEFLDDYTYGDPEEEWNTVTLELAEDGDDWDASIFAPEVGTDMPEILDDGWFDSEEDAIEWFKNECTSSSRIKQVLDGNRSDASVTASVKTSMDEDSNGYSFWGEEPTEDGGFSVWYGEFQEPQNSLPVDVDYYDASAFSYDPDTTGYYTISLRTSTEWDAEDISSEISDVSHDTLDETWQELKEDLPFIAPDYLIPVKEFDEMKANGEIETASVKTASTYEFLDDYTYGDPNEEWNAVTLEMTEEDGGYDASIFGPDINPGELPELIEGGWFYSEAEVLDWFKGECMSSSRIERLLDKNRPDPSATASVKISGVYSVYSVRDSGDEISGSYEIPGDPTSQKFWSARPDDSNGWAVTVSSNYGYTKIFNAPSKEDVVPMLEEWLDDSKNPDAISNGTYATASVKTSKITNSNGYEFDDSQWDAIVNLMDDEVREQVANELDDPTEQEFFDVYAKAHENRFGEEWELDKANPVW